MLSHNWKELSEEIENLLRLKTKVVAFRRLNKIEDLNDIPGISKPVRLCTFCQVIFMARIVGKTVGVTRQDCMLDRCMRIHGLKTPSEKSRTSEAKSLATTWFSSFEDALKQQDGYPRIPAGEAIAVAPLAQEKFEPEVILIYGNPAQIMMFMCGLEKEKYERFQFFFIGDGACADSLGQCYTTGKPAIAIPCYAERALGHVADDEIVVALPPNEVTKAILGLRKLSNIGLKYPIRYLGGEADVTPLLSELYPQDFKH
jgi:uncharacterized protein (DUF169 family)